MMSLPFIIGAVTFLVIIGAALAACPARVGAKRKYAAFNAEFSYVFRGREGCNIDPASARIVAATYEIYMHNKSAGRAV